MSNSAYALAPKNFVDPAIWCKYPIPVLIALTALLMFTNGFFHPYTISMNNMNKLNDNSLQYSFPAYDSK